MRKEDQQRLLAAVFTRVSREILVEHLRSGQGLDEILAESVFLAQRSIPAVHAWQKLFKFRSELTTSAKFWESIRRRLGRADAFEQRMLLSRVLWHYLHEIAGNFNASLYSAVRRLAPAVLGLILHASSPKRLMMSGGQGLAAVDEAIVIQGQIEQLRRLYELGTVVLVPTYASHLDALVLGFALYQLNLAPFVYGADHTLFQNPLLKFFLHNLGAYRINRQNSDYLYKLLVKQYSSLILEFGYNCFVFPGGVRSRSGSVEKRLKLGLLGSTLTALIHNLQQERLRAKIFVVPVTVSYQLVLEAETLINAFLQDMGAARYIITDDEFSRPDRIFDFVTQLFGLDSKIYVTIGQGLDPLGHLVDEQGESLDPCNRRIDVRWFLTEKTAITINPDRDRQYTTELGVAILQAFMRDNVIQATHVLAWVMIALMRAQSPTHDMLRLVRIGGKSSEGFLLSKVYRQAAILLDKLYQLEQQNILRLAESVKGAVEDVVASGLRHLQIYHRTPVVVRRGDRIIPQARNLLYYYHNRLAGYQL